MNRKYELIDQEPNKCVPAVLQMILRRKGLKTSLTQEEISNYFNIDENGFIHVNNLNDEFFIPLNLDIMENYIKCKDSFIDVAKVVYNMLEFFKNKEFPYFDFIIWGNYRYIIGDTDFIKNHSVIELNNCQHVFLLQEYNGNDQDITLVCPETKENGRTHLLKTNAKNIIDAILFEHSGGISYVTDCIRSINFNH